jgi:5-methylthioadenosine/S-adenosylhomocysteine deaminase
VAKSTAKSTPKKKTDSAPAKKAAGSKKSTSKATKAPAKKPVSTKAAKASPAKAAKPAAKKAASTKTTKPAAKKAGPAKTSRPVAKKPAAVKAAKPATKKTAPVKTAKAPAKKPAAKKPAAARSIKVASAAPSGQSLLIRGATIVTLNLIREVVQGDLRIVDGRIAAIGKRLKPRKDELVVDATGLTVFPGFFQMHVHLCQTLFRHMGEDMALFDWLRNRVWPLEAAHNQASLKASAQLGLAEMLLSGTTSFVSMETTHGTEHALEEIVSTGMRAFSGKALMDGGRGVPARLKESTKKALDSAGRMLGDWQGKGGLEIILNPRFAPSCTPDLLKEVGRLAAEANAWIHTHVAETRDEVQLTRETFGRNPILLYEALGYLDGKFIGVHAVHLTEAEKLRLAGRNSVALVHCPSANMKLASGIAPLADLLSRGIRVGLGADGAACNNALSMLREMRLAGLLQKVSRGASALNAQTILELATIDAATAMGIDGELGSIEVGKRADLALFDLNHPSIQPAGTPAQQLVWAASERDLVHTLVNGRFMVRDRKLVWQNQDELLKTARREAQKLVSRAGLEGKVPFGG